MSIDPNVFACPICSCPMKKQGGSLVCTNGHCFDLARQGYVNMMPHARQTKYDAALFAARRAIVQHGCFDPLLEQIGERIVEWAAQQQRLYVLDAGCGEGSHLTRLQQMWEGKVHGEMLAAGIDLSKEAIRMAAKQNPHATWCVGDLAHSPFAAGAFDCIVSLLSPSNYAEFDRLLAPQGIVIKVIPGQSYLQEIRSHLHKPGKQDEAGSERTTLLLQRHFLRTTTRRVQYDVPVDKDTLASLLRMTPLSWGATEEQLQSMVHQPYKTIAFDFTILVGTR